jgi:hypothetical protein
MAPECDIKSRVFEYVSPSAIFLGFGCQFLDEDSVEGTIEDACHTFLPVITDPVLADA